MNVAAMLTKLYNTKLRIAQAIIDKGVTVPQDLPFEAYPERIALIKQGVIIEGGGGALSVQDTAQILYTDPFGYDQNEPIAFLAMEQRVLETALLQYELREFYYVRRAPAATPISLRGYAPSGNIMLLFIIHRSHNDSEITQPQDWAPLCELNDPSGHRLYVFKKVSTSGYESVEIDRTPNQSQGFAYGQIEGVMVGTNVGASDAEVYYSFDSQSVTNSAGQSFSVPDKPTGAKMLWSAFRWDDAFTAAWSTAPDDLTLVSGAIMTHSQFLDNGAGAEVSRTFQSPALTGNVGLVGFELI